MGARRATSNCRALNILLSTKRALHDSASQQVSALERRNARGSRPADRVATPGDLVSRRSRHRHTSIRGREHNMVDRRLLLSLNQDCRNTGHHNKVRSPGKRCNNLRSLQPKTGLIAAEPAKSLASIRLLFYSRLLDQLCSSSYNTYSVSVEFPRLASRLNSIQRLDRALHQPLSRTRQCSRQLPDCRDGHIPLRFPTRSCEW